MTAARVGDAITTGHGCDAVTTIAGPGAPTVLINNIPAARVGDSVCAGTITSGSANVIIG